MLKGVNLTKGIVVTLANKMGVLADMSKILADHSINCPSGCPAKIILSTSDNAKALVALKAK